MKIAGCQIKMLKEGMNFDGNEYKDVNGKKINMKRFDMGDICRSWICE